MKKIFKIFILIITISSCKNAEKIDFKYVTTKFREYSDNINKVEYNAHQIDSFPGGTVWNNKGFAFIEKDKNDKIFGFSFFGQRYDVPKIHIYDKGNGFEISTKSKSFEIETNTGTWFLGKPGGQMITTHIFALDSIYKSAELIQKEDKYILKYRFADDTTYNVTKIIKLIELNKDNFFPTKVTLTSEQLGNRVFQQLILSDVKINNETSNSIQKYKDDLKDYRIIQPQEIQTNKILGKTFPAINFPDLRNENKIVQINIGKLILIDFWEVWCGHCINAFPEVEKIKNKYSDILQVVGIVTEDRANAIKLIENKNGTFLNLIGTKDLLKEYGVNSYPRYFLVDKNGIVKKEYMGFSEQIEKDIKEMTKE